MNRWPRPPLHPGRLVAAGLSLVLLLAVTVAGSMYRSGQSPPHTPEAECARSPQRAEASIPWRFRFDPEDAGVAGGWFEPRFDDRQWDASAPGQAWDDQGYPIYVGVAWYRATFDPPVDWGIAYLGVGGVDDTARLWVDGQEMDWDPTGGPATQIVPLPAGRPLQITFRVVNNGGPGGIKQPVWVAQEPWAALPPDAYARWLAALHPDWPMPGWARNEYYAWTFTGMPGAANRALLGADGAVAPWSSASAVGLWLYDPGAGAVVAPRPAMSLLDGSLPIPQADWAAAGLQVHTVLYRGADGDGVRWRVALRNNTEQAREATILAAVRPLAFNPGLHPAYAAGFDNGGRLWVDGQPFMQAAPAPTQAGAGTMADVLQAAIRGNVPSARNLPCAPSGDAAASLTFPVRLGPGESYELVLSFPADPGASFPSRADGDGLERARAAWKENLGAPHIVIPDQLITDAYRASLGYLLLSLSEGGPRPGPLEHNKVWVRDAAFIGEALLGAGQGRWVSDYLPNLFAYQAEDGRIPAIIGPSGPEPEDEWDAQGQAIFLVASLYRYDRDRVLLERWEPAVRMSAQFLRELRARTAGDPPATRGLLPASRSAEDLGPPTYHHYWDDFWGVAGLEEAAFIEEELGRNDEAAWMRAEAESLRRAIQASVESVMGPAPAYIPGAPEDKDSSAMARGSSVALYPVEVMRWEDSLAQRSFAEYYRRWIAPNNGAYRHVFGQWWPYGGMGLARDYLRLGQQDKVHGLLAWVLGHQTLPGTYAWAEQVSPAHGGITGGDMPHAWAAATYVTLIREMLAMRRSDSLVLFAGVPPSWLEAGKTVGLREAPTEFGTLTALTESDLRMREDRWEGTLTLTIRGTAHPPGGFAWTLPRLPSGWEGPPGTGLRDGRLLVPASGGTVRLRYDVAAP